MRKRFITQPLQDPATDSPNGPLIEPEETTHRYSNQALADIRSAIAQAQATPPPQETSAAGPEVTAGAMPSWAAALPPMAAAESPGLTEVTQRYADRSVAGIRAAIAAAREAEAEASTARSNARLAMDEKPYIQVPSMVLEPRPAAADVPATADAPERDDAGKS